MPWHLVIRIGRAILETLWFRKLCPVNHKYNASHAYLCRRAPFF